MSFCDQEEQARILSRFEQPWDQRWPTFEAHLAEIRRQRSEYMSAMIGKGFKALFRAVRAGFLALARQAARLVPHGTHGAGNRPLGAR
jgi:hypothetical protein